MEDLTEKEIRELPWSGGETCALVDRNTKVMRYASDSKEWLLGVMLRMGKAHPEYHKLQLVERPKTI